MKASLHNLGCKVNSYETESMQQTLEAAGYEIVSFNEPADLIIINTCSVTNIADRKSRQMIHRARKLSPEAVIVACGCYAQMFSEDLVADDSADIILGNNNKHRLLEAVDEFRSKKDKLCWIKDLSKACEYEGLHSEDTAEHTRAYIKIQDGCNQFCTYCIIPYARGRIRSREPEDVMKEVYALAKKGFKEVVLTGIHVSSYGSGHDFTLIDIIEKIATVEGIERIRLSSLEPRVITEEFLDRLVKIDKVCPHFHLSLQSGCDSVLKRMNRKYTTAEYADRVKLLRKYYNHPAITTDIIVGFPGETNEEFETTLDFAADTKIFEIHIFKYSRRKGTKADKMEGQLPESVKSERSDRLEVVASQNTREFLEGLVGEEVEVLFEEKVTIDGNEYYLGHSKEYATVVTSDIKKNLTNVIKSGKIKGFVGKNYLEME